LKAHPDIRLVFVTNSRVSLVARYMKSMGLDDMMLIGYDFLPANIEYLKEGVIDFLICEKPQEQAYRGIKALYRNLVFDEKYEKNYFMPIDIINKANQAFYKN